MYISISQLLFITTLANLKKMQIGPLANYTSSHCVPRARAGLPDIHFEIFRV